jgi:hypothetical protein
MNEHVPGMELFLERTIQLRAGVVSTILRCLRRKTGPVCGQGVDAVTWVCENWHQKLDILWTTMNFICRFTGL